MSTQRHAAGSPSSVGGQWKPNDHPDASADLVDPSAAEYVSQFSEKERDIVLATLVAQVQDVHQPVFMWNEEDYEVARGLMERLTDTPPGDDPMTTGDTPEAQSIVRSLMVQIYDLDHPELTPEQWAAAERLLSAVER